MRLNPGESVRYVRTEYQADVPNDRARAWEFIDGSWGYDVERYTELLMRAVESVFVPFGVSASMLRSWPVKELPAEHLRARLEARPPRAYLGPLFELALAASRLGQSFARTGYARFTIARPNMRITYNLSIPLHPVTAADIDPSGETFGIPQVSTRVSGASAPTQPSPRSAGDRFALCHQSRPSPDVCHPD